MTTTELPSRATMLKALRGRDDAFDGVFWTGVRTTRIFCRPVCPARAPRAENLEFFPSARAALAAGFRPCKRCRPLETPGDAPPWLRPLLARLEEDATRRWTDADLRAAGFAPVRVRRWFREHHGLTFHGYCRARRLGGALARLRGGATVTAAAFDQGWDSLSAFHEAFRKLAGAAPTAACGAEVVSVTRIATPLGAMLAAAGEHALLLLEFGDRSTLERQIARLGRRREAVLVPGANAILERLAGELDDYFTGRAQSFSTPLAPAGTPFQRQVWDALRRIPHGATRSYAELAHAIGRPRAVRAVARANGANPIAILIPCHRVVGSDGSLTGYGGGLWRKRRLLELEQASARPIS